MSERLTRAFEGLVATNRWSGVRLHARMRDPIRGVIALDVTYPSGVMFCCYEPGCHFCWAGGSFRRLRAALDDAGFDVPFPITLHVDYVVERGSRFGVNRAFMRDPSTEEEHRFEHTYRESGCGFMPVPHFLAACDASDEPPALISTLRALAKTDEVDDAQVGIRWLSTEEWRPSPAKERICVIGNRDLAERLAARLDTRVCTAWMRPDADPGATPGLHAPAPGDPLYFVM